MKTTLNKLPKSKLELTIELSPEELTPFLSPAAERLSSKNKITGFRPGKLPYVIIEKQLGEMAIYEEAMEDILNDSYFKALKEKQLLPVEKPKIEILKFAPKNPLIYKATFAVFPIVKCGDLKKVKIQRKEIKISEEQVQNVLKELQKMRAQEKIAERKIQKGDKVLADMEVFVDKVAIEGGQSKNAQIIIGDSMFIPGLEDNLIGLSKNDAKEFSLKFPKDYHEKKIADKLADFKVKINEVYQIDYPEINDEFAKNLGKFENVEDLKKKLKENLETEDKIKEDQRLEADMLNQLVDNSTFEEIPDVLIEQESERLVAELEASVQGQRMDFNHYLEHLKKTREQLKDDFKGKAEKRIKTMLLIEDISRIKKFEVSEKEIEEAKEEAISQYGNNAQILKNLESEDYKNYLNNLVRNRKVINFLKSEILK